MNIPLHVLFIAGSAADIQPVLDELYQGHYMPIHLWVDNAEMMQLALRQNHWDIVICDDLLAGFSATEALKILAATKIDIPCIVLSSISGADVAVEMMRAGANDYLFKGHLKRLVPAIVRELRQAEVRRAKQQVETSVLRLAAIVESSEDAIVSTDLQGRVLTWNIGAERLYGYSVTEAKGKALTQLIQPNNPILLTIPVAHSPIRVVDCRRVTQQRKTGELVEVLLTVSLIKDDDNQVIGFAIVARMMDEHQRIRQMKNEFISVINHELRTPLTSLQGSIELLLTGKLGDLSERGLRMLEIAANNVDRLVKVTSNILALEELNSGDVVLQKQTCDIGEVISRSAAKAQAMAVERGVYLFIAQPSIQLSLDCQRIEHVLYHLITNAIQSSQAGGKIWLDVELREDPKANSLCSSYVLIMVRDEGRGIPSDKLEAIFDQFQQVDASDTRPQGGMGLGLTLCRSIVQQHQGDLWVESTLGQGSTFYLTLPTQRVAVQA